jgi:uncharacterized protein YbaR (Trm112 family)
VVTDLIDTLRCPAAHEDSWLVASSTRSQGRHIMEGRLGCPVCQASVAIVDGVAQFGAPASDGRTPELDHDSAFRLAAQLHLIDAPSPILLAGVWTAAVPALRRITPGVRIFAGDPVLTLAADDQVSVLTLPDGRLPLAAASLRGLALDAVHAREAALTDAARVMRTGGRLVTPVGMALDPDCWAPLVSDAVVQVAERRPAASAPVQLRRAPAQPLFTP